MEITYLSTQRHQYYFDVFRIRSSNKRNTVLSLSFFNPVISFHTLWYQLDLAIFHLQARLHGMKKTKDLATPTKNRYFTPFNFIPLLGTNGFRVDF